VIIVAAVLVVHVMLAIWVRDHANRKPSEMPDYRTHVGAVTLHFWRGAYSVHNINVVKTSGKSTGAVFLRANVSSKTPSFRRLKEN